MKKKGSQTKVLTPGGKNLSVLTNTILLYEKELRQIASIMHEEAGQSLVALKMKLEAIQGNIRKGDYQELQTLTGGIIKTIRDSIAELSPSLLYDFGLIPALQWLCGSMKTRTGIDIDLDAKEDKVPAYDLEATIILYRTVKALLSLIVCETGPSRIAIKLGTGKTRMVISFSVDARASSKDIQRLLTHPDIPTLEGWIGSIGGQFSVEDKKEGHLKLILQCPLTASPR